MGRFALKNTTEHRAAVGGVTPGFGVSELRSGLSGPSVLEDAALLLVLLAGSRAGATRERERERETTRERDYEREREIEGERGNEFSRKRGGVRERDDNGTDRQREREREREGGGRQRVSKCVGGEGD